MSDCGRGASRRVGILEVLLLERRAVTDGSLLRGGGGKNQVLSELALRQ